jgi:hypothetical protein
MSAVPQPLAGGCQCGRVRFEITDEPLTLYCCHCTECQKQSSSAFGMSLPLKREAVRVTAGVPKAWTRIADSGNRVVCTFCGDCGTRLFHESEVNPGILVVKPGTLDDTSWLAPIGHIWTASAQAWLKPHLDGVSHERQPADGLRRLSAAWRAGRFAGHEDE